MFIIFLYTKCQSICYIEIYNYLSQLERIPHSRKYYIFQKE